MNARRIIMPGASGQQDRNGPMMHRRRSLIRILSASFQVELVAPSFMAWRMSSWVCLELDVPVHMMVHDTHVLSLK
jgi:hypothetical protein